MKAVMQRNMLVIFYIATRLTTGIRRRTTERANASAAFARGLSLPQRLYEAQP